jgi:hypothetical protein
LAGVNTLAILDARVSKAFGFNDSEQALIDDLFEITLQDFKGGPDSPGRMPTRKRGQATIKEADTTLIRYCEFLLRVLTSGFDRSVVPRATIFHENNRALLPVRLVGVHFDQPTNSVIAHHEIDSVDLLNRLYRLNELLLESSRAGAGGIFYQRVALIYSSIREHNRKVPSVFIVKPDQQRYWTRSAAMQDADKIAGDMCQSRMRE